MGVSFPVETRDAVNFRTLNMGYNLQAQYNLMPSASHPWTIFKRSLHTQKVLYSEDKNFRNDETRQMFYNAVEILMLR